MRIRLFAALLVVSSFAGCELVGTFDSDKIPPPELMRPYASFPVESVDDVDSSSADAGRDDAVDGSRYAWGPSPLC